jgi:apolipoprotein N-acyltransferase
MREGNNSRVKIILVLLSASGGLLAGLAWTSWFPGLILLVALVPFFLTENYIFENQEKYRANAYFLYILPGTIIFNVITVGWVRAASVPAVITVITGMSFLMSFILWLGHIVRIRTGIITASIAIISLWLAFELLSLSFALLSPWINLGNGLAKDILFIQWYEVTGVSGGTLWILLSNLFLTLFIVNSLRREKSKNIFLWIWAAIVIIPSALSVTRFYTIKSGNEEGNEVVIIQPNIDPYSEKFSIPFKDQLNKTLDMASEVITDTTSWLLTPETTVDDPVNEQDTDSNKYIIALSEFAGQHPGLSIISGLVSFRLYYPANEPPSNSARKIDSSGFWYDHFNSAFMIDPSGVKSIYHKSKLVPGIEMQFSSGLGRLISKIVPYLGGTKWGYGIQKEKTCFIHPYTGQIAAPIICYESVFGDYVAEYVRKGANALFIITNDGWWKNTAGYKQHLSYASLRAIETRRQVARCANTGISCIIDIRGKRTVETEWWTEDILRGNVSSETRLTPYVRYGDCILRLSAFLSILILAYVFVALPVRK